MRFRLWTVASLLLLSSVIAAHQAQRPSPASRAADTVIPGVADAMTLDTPVYPSVVAATIERLLTAANVRFGFEAAPLDPKQPIIDLARMRESVVPLGGRTVGEALDLVVKAAPIYRWTEINGVIVVRATRAGDGFLDRRLTDFSVTDATPRGAMEAVIAAIDPARSKGMGIIGFGRPGSGAMNAGVRAGNNVTLSMQNATVESVLAAIARLNGSLSWTVKYDEPPAGSDTAVLTFIENGETVQAWSPLSMRNQAGPVPAGPPIGAGPGRGMSNGPVRVQLSGSLPSILSSYTAQTGTRVGVEEVAQVSQPGIIDILGGGGPLGLPPLDLTGVPAADAVARLVALDSRYEWTQTKRGFIVRPKPGVSGRIPVLDATYDGFSASNEPASSVLERALEKVGTARVSTGPPPGSVAASRGNPITTAMATPVTFTLTGTVTVRDVLEAFSEATGWTWSLRPQFRPGAPTALSLQVRASTAGGSWSSGVSIMTTTDFAPSPMPEHPVARRIPAALDADVTRLNLDPDMTGTLNPFELLALRARVSMGIEMLPRPAVDTDPRHRRRPAPPILVGPGKFSDALYVLLEKMPDYEITSIDGIVGVAPTSLLKTPGYFMNRTLASFTATNEGLYHAVGRLRQTINSAWEPRDWTGPGAATLNKPVTVSLTRTTVRDVLNALVRSHGSMAWSMYFDGASATEPARAREEDWQLRFVPIDNSGGAVIMGPLQQEAAGGRPQPPNVGLPRPSGPSVAIDLPASAPRLRSTFMQIGRAFRVPIGGEFELPVVTAGSGLALLGPTPEYYDLTGLALPETLAKITALLPEYVAVSDAGVYHLQPRALRDDPTTWLNQKVDRFEQHFNNIRDAAAAVAAIGIVQPAPVPARGAVPGAPIGVMGGLPQRGGGPPPPPPPAPPDPRMVTSITINLTNVTVRDVLDDIARKHGGMMWTVQYRTSPTGQKSVQLDFYGFDGWVTGGSVR